MRESKHTQGPWVADTFKTGSYEIVSNGLVICSRNAFEERSEEMLANASLIAAAPELLEAGSSVQYNALDWDGGEYVDVRKDDFDDLVRAISKADGLK